MTNADLATLIQQASRKLKDDMEAALPSREDQHARLERLIDHAGEVSAARARLPQK